MALFADVRSNRFAVQICVCSLLGCNGPLEQNLRVKVCAPVENTYLHVPTHRDTAAGALIPEQTFPIERTRDMRFRLISYFDIY